MAAAPPMVLVPAPPEPAEPRWRALAGALGDAALVLLLGVLFPIAILAVGTPIALVVRALIEILQRF
jgi:hypothetical protein